MSVLRVRFPEREDALRGNVELVDEHENRVAVGHLEVDGPLGAGDLTAPVRFVGAKILAAADLAASDDAAAAVAHPDWGQTRGLGD